MNILDAKRKKGETHIGSALSAQPIIDMIFSIKDDNDRVVLSCGHSAMALYRALLEEGAITEKEMLSLPLHATRGYETEVSTGSLGHGISIAVGMAMADPTSNVYVVVSDGECMEGSFWEALRIARDFKLQNLGIYINANGFGGYDPIDIKLLTQMIDGFGFPVAVVSTNGDFEDVKGLDAHYKP